MAGGPNEFEIVEPTMFREPTCSLVQRVRRLPLFRFVFGCFRDERRFASDKELLFSTQSFVSQ